MGAAISSKPTEPSSEGSLLMLARRVMTSMLTLCQSESLQSVHKNTVTFPKVPPKDVWCFVLGFK
jgi:hypothetical protein